MKVGDVVDLTIEKIYKNTENKSGEPYTTKDGKPFSIVNIYSKGTRYTYFDFDNTADDWEEGMQIEVKIKKEDEYQGDKQYTIDVPSKTDLMHNVVQDLINRVQALEEDMKAVRIALDIEDTETDQKQSDIEEIDADEDIVF
jgi:hypothetical protein